MKFQMRTGGGHGRTSEVFLFDLQLLEQPAGAPGWNDPVYLYGRMYGPYPESAGERPVGVEGQLTLTRGDLLQGLVDEAAGAFRCAGTGDAEGQARRCFHMMLPGDAEAEIRGGSGLILSYPLLPAELITDDVSNEIVVSQLLFDMLSALKEDLEREQAEHPLRGLTLPVPSRASLEQQLRSQGYEIEGDTAFRKAASGEGFKGLLASVFGALTSESVELPPEADIDEMLDLANRVLKSLPGWPPPRAQALRERVRPAPARNNAGLVRPGPYRTPQLTAPIPPPVRPPQPVRRSSEPPEWMKDFMSAHQLSSCASATVDVDNRIEAAYSSSQEGRFSANRAGVDQRFRASLSCQQNRRCEAYPSIKTSGPSGPARQAGMDGRFRVVGSPA